MRTRRRAEGAVAAALVLAACGSSRSSGGAAANPSLADPEAGWMDDAEVRVTGDPCAGTTTVELVDVAAGRRMVVDSETFAPDAACHGS